MRLNNEVACSGRAKSGVLSVLVAAAIAGCGGGGGSADSGSSGAATSNAANCATGSRSNLIAVSLYGDVGTASVTSGGAQISIVAGGSTTTRSLQADTASNVCADTVSTKTMRTAFTSQGQVGMSFATIASVDQPVFLMSGSTLATSLASLQGTYNVLRYQKDTPTSGAAIQTRSSYATMVIDNAGTWYFCKNTATCTSGSATGNGTINVNGSNADRFDLVAGGVTRGTLFLSSNGGSKVLVVGEDDQGDPSGRVRGLWVGVPRAAWAANDGAYTLNTTDMAKNSLSMTANVIAASSTITATIDAPMQGFLTAQSGGDDNYIIQTVAGLFVTAKNTGNNFANGPGYFSFGVKP
jgi:hypothetical protein